MTSTSSHRIAVLGAGRSGRAAANLASRLGAEVTVFDDSPPDRLQTAIGQLQKDGHRVVTGSEIAGEDLRESRFEMAILSPGIDASWPLPQRFQEAGIPLTGEMEFASRHCETPLIAITGTNGKSTCTELIAAILNGAGKRSVPCGNHGMPLSEVLLSGESYDALALEVSSFQLETIDRFHPRVMIWLNFAADHLDRYPDLESYFQAKARLFENATAQDLAIVRQGEDVSSQAATRVTFSAYQDNADWTLEGSALKKHGTAVADTTTLSLRGRHNLENLLAAVAACEVFGVAPSEAVPALQSYHVAPHRCELVRQLEGREFINDSKATNVHAVQACVQALDVPLVLIAGGKEKNLDYTPLRKVLPQHVHHLVTIGETGPRMVSEFEDLLPCEHAADLPAAVDRAFQISRPGDAVVLSPGTSSFDMFAGYGARGDAFREAVQHL